MTYDLHVVFISSQDNVRKSAYELLEKWKPAIRPLTATEETCENPCSETHCLMEIGELLFS